MSALLLLLYIFKSITLLYVYNMIGEFIALCIGIVACSWLIFKICHDGANDYDEYGVAFGDD